MRRDRSEMKPFPFCGGVTIAPVVFSFRSLFFSGKRLNVNFCADSRNSGGVQAISLSDILFVKKTEQVQIWCDFCYLI
jgi:hypothetical protein